MSEALKPSSEPEEILVDLHIQDGNDKTQPEVVQLEGSQSPPHTEVVDNTQPVSSPEFSQDQPDSRKSPKVNCTEKIVFCIDLSKEMEETRFTMRNGQTLSGVQMVKRTLEIFIQTKHAMDSKHQFALVILTDTVVWITDFMNNAKEICDVLKDLNETSPCNSCDFSALFTTILEKTSLPQVVDPEVTPIPFVIRAVIIYGRSQTEPIINETCPAFRSLLESNYFFMDFLYIHLPVSDDNNVQTIFDKICDLDLNNVWYVLELTHMATKMHNKMASLLGHPLQRPIQNHARYRIQA